MDCIGQRIIPSVDSGGFSEITGNISGKILAVKLIKDNSSHIQCADWNDDGRWKKRIQELKSEEYTGKQSCAI